MTNLHMNRPQFDTQQASALARSLFRVDGAATELPSERDQNYHLHTVSGDFVLKISSAAEARTVLELQNSALNHIAQYRTSHNGQGAHTLDLCPAVVSAAGGQILTTPGANGRQHFVRLLTYLEGKPLAKIKPHSAELLHALGGFMGELDRALADFDHPAAPTDFHWDLQNAAGVIEQHVARIADPQRRALVDHFLDRFKSHVQPRFSELRRSIIHNDGNDYNIIVQFPACPAATRSPPRAGIIDFGDMVRSYTVIDLAVTAAYAILDKPDPLAAAVEMTQGYHAAYPLTEAEVSVLWDLICMRLALSVSLCAYQQTLEPDNEYLRISEKPAWAMLARLRDLHPHLAHYALRHACGWSPCPAGEALSSWLRENKATFRPVIDHDLKSTPAVVYDLSIGSLELGSDWDTSDTSAFTRRIFDRMASVGAQVAIGRYNEARPIYTGDLFATASESARRTVHLGIDLFLPAGSPVYAPLEGVVHSLANNANFHDYGPTIILAHEPINGPRFYSLYGHLSVESLDGLQPGQSIKKGTQIATIGDHPINGDWPPHLHFQIISDLLERYGEFPGVAAASQREVWLSICPDPNLILQIPADRFPKTSRTKAELIAVRRQKLGKSLSTSYKRHLHIVSGRGQYLYDETGRPYLDGVNNVCHVGHAHPYVAAAGQRQMAVLNTNTRYLHDNLVDYVERLTATLPDPLSVCFLVCSGSEANELALRLARTYTNQQDIITVDAAYHGNTQALIEISPYKFAGAGGKGAPPYVHTALMPDPYRGQFKGYGLDAGHGYAQHVGQLVKEMQAHGSGPAAYICESLLGCGGQIVLPAGYLAEAYRLVRAAGGVCIADEVQVGFGRVGSHMWGFELQGVVPDIVTMGKPIGNGHPLAAVVTTPEIADAFANGMEYFNTFGGNPVSCAIGLAVLDVIEREGLQQNALEVGSYLLAQLEPLKEKYALVGDVRGRGLFIGIELVLDRVTLEPAPRHASYVVERAKELGLLLSTDGPLHNVIKFKPPIVFDKSNADFMVRVLDEVLQDDVLQRRICE
ncbi:MAG: aminotransferase class III-fold pyridoxal phosphate-dependent enzyme [Caldilineaceae bacterium]